MIFSKTFLRMKRWNEDIFCLGRKFLQSSSGLKKICVCFGKKKIREIFFDEENSQLLCLFFGGGDQT